MQIAVILLVQDSKRIPRKNIKAFSGSPDDRLGHPATCSQFQITPKQGHCLYRRNSEIAELSVRQFAARTPSLDLRTYLTT